MFAHSPFNRDSNNKVTKIIWMKQNGNELLFCVTIGFGNELLRSSTFVQPPDS